jgi:hypothetical protein
MPQKVVVERFSCDHFFFGFIGRLCHGWARASPFAVGTAGLGWGHLTRALAGVRWLGLETPHSSSPHGGPEQTRYDLNRRCLLSSNHPRCNAGVTDERGCFRTAFTSVWWSSSWLGSAYIAHVPQRAPPTSRGGLGKLGSSSCAEWREAQLHLAHRGSEALEPLDDWASSATSEQKERVRDVLDFALRKYTTFTDLERKWPNLAATIRPDVERAARLVLPFAKANVHDIGEGPLLPPGVTAEPSNLQVALEELRKLGGFGVPSAEALCKSDNPVARAYGIALLTTAGATLHVPLVRKLASDFTPIEQAGGDWSGHTTVAKVASQSSLLNPVSTPIDEFESYVLRFDSDLLNGIRQTSRAFEAKTFDEWWTEARPAWQKWWELSPGCARAPDRQAWSDWTIGKRGYFLTADQSGNSLRVVAYDQGHCQVLREGKVIAQGALPFSMEIPASATVRITVRTSHAGAAEVVAATPRFLDGLLPTRDDSQELRANSLSGATRQAACTRLPSLGPCPKRARRHEHLSSHTPA